MQLDVNPHDDGVQIFFLLLRKLVELIDTGTVQDKVDAFSLAKQFDIEQKDNKLTGFVKGLQDDVFRSRVGDLLQGDPHEIISRINEVLIPPDAPGDAPSADSTAPDVPV